ncbi:MAG: hypothetical protein QNJ72_34850, partial [Pleurocapsa sp. MO_226.B13]|nr:hypothetical protein [Pleurocapsa sp. MO_226.B13]
LWQNEFNQIKNKITRLRQLSSPELVEMLMSVMRVLGVRDLKPKLLSGTYTVYSFTCQVSKRSPVSILWNEDANLRSFAFFIKAVEKAIKLNPNLSLIMIRSESIGNKNNQGYKIYEQIFNNSSHRHIRASLESVHYLKTYQKLVNDARSGDLVLNYQPLKSPQLQELVRQTKILEQCKLLQELGIVKVIDRPNASSDEEDKKIQELKELKDFLLNFVKHHQFLGRATLIKQAKTQFYDAAETDIEKQIQQLVKERKISIINPQATPQERLICLIPAVAAGGKK